MWLEGMKAHAHLYAKLNTDIALCHMICINKTAAVLLHPPLQASLSISINYTNNMHRAKRLLCMLGLNLIHVADLL